MPSIAKSWADATDTGETVNQSNTVTDTDQDDNNRGDHEGNDTEASSQNPDLYTVEWFKKQMMRSDDVYRIIPLLLKDSGEVHISNNQTIQFYTRANACSSDNRNNNLLRFIVGCADSELAAKHIKPYACMYEPCNVDDGQNNGRTLNIYCRATRIPEPGYLKFERNTLLGFQVEVYKGEDVDWYKNCKEYFFLPADIDLNCTRKCVYATIHGNKACNMNKVSYFGIPRSEDRECTLASSRRSDNTLIKYPWQSDGKLEEYAKLTINVRTVNNATEQCNHHRSITNDFHAKGKGKGKSQEQIRDIENRLSAMNYTSDHNQVSSWNNQSQQNQAVHSGTAYDPQQTVDTSTSAQQSNSAHNAVNTYTDNQSYGNTNAYVPQVNTDRALVQSLMFPVNSINTPTGSNAHVAPAQHVQLPVYNTSMAMQGQAVYIPGAPCNWGNTQQVQQCTGTSNAQRDHSSSTRANDANFLKKASMHDLIKEISTRVLG